ARAWEVDRGRRLAFAHTALFGVIGLGMALGWTGAGPRLYAAIIDTVDAAAKKSIAAGLPAALALVLALRAAASAERRRALVVTIVTVTMIASLPSVAVGLGLVASHRAVRELARNVARLAGPDDVVAHEGPIENSGAFEWYAGRRPVFIDARRSVLGCGAERPEARDLFWDEARLRD